jgi:carboxypeptidase C (cathepsin A)
VSPFIDVNEQAFSSWDFSHVDPTGAESGGIDRLYTAGDLAAAMALNPYLRVFAANGYYDAVTPFFQTILNFEKMPLSEPDKRGRLIIRNFKSGHMIYLDNESRAAMKAELAEFYKGSNTHAFAAAARRRHEDALRIRYTPYRRRFSQIPY